MSPLFLTVLFLIINHTNGQGVLFASTEKVNRLIKVCDICTCSEIMDIDRTHLVLNIQCYESDRVEDIGDLDKIEWPPNPNGLKISAAFERMALRTLGK